MAPTTQRTIMVGRLDCAVTSRDDTGRAVATAGPVVSLAVAVVADHIAAMRRSGAGPMAGGADRLPRTGRTPLYGSRGRDS